MSDSQHDRRRFSRIDFRTGVELRERNDSCKAVLRDISLKGFLIDKPRNWPFDSKPKLDAHIHLSDEDEIRMKVELAHEANGQLGFQCIAIDMESIGHLRRLIELNLGDPQAAERELCEFI